MKYISEYQINTAIDNLANSVLKGEYDNVNDTATLMYYAMRIRGGLDTLHRMMPSVPKPIEDQLVAHIGELQNAMNHISDLIKNKEGTGSLYFSDLTKDQDLQRHPYVKLLSDYRIKGMALPRAISMTSLTTGVPELSISNFINQHDIKYPVINESSNAYIVGQEDARRLVGTNINDVGTRMHEMQLKYLNSKDQVEPEDSNSYIAGFSSVMNYKFDQSFIKSESDKASLLA